MSFIICNLELKELSANGRERRPIFEMDIRREQMHLGMSPSILAKLTQMPIPFRSSWWWSWDILWNFGLGLFLTSSAGWRSEPLSEMDKNLIFQEAMGWIVVMLKSPPRLFHGFFCRKRFRESNSETCKECFFGAGKSEERTNITWLVGVM